MSLFQKSVVNKYLTNIDNSIVIKAYDQFKQFYGDAERIENIRLLKEENYQEGFLREIFVDVLGYTINPNINYNLTTEYKNETDSKKADGAILFNGQAVGVIELKSTKTPNLDSIREQAFNYKNHQPNCRFVITSNFEKLRLYIDNATDWEEFNLFNFDFENFRRFYLFLSKHSISVGITAKLKEESKLHEENISNQLYKDYSVFKNQLYYDLIKLNPGQDKLSLFHKSQKLLDRILFVLFAEDRLLIPPNTISEVINQWNIFKKYDDPKPLYFHFVKLFNHLDSGYKYDTYELHAYNGGLFKKDELLDNLIISDELLHSNTITLSKYGYNSEVDVNILGHIFENSISEIEQVKAEIEGEQTDKNRSRRKKEGIFYTPKYITKYIVDNTIGTLCNEKKKELGIIELENDIIKNNRTKKGTLRKVATKIVKKLDTYRTYLLSLKILDPACGSGAFLIQALDYLIYEHTVIEDYKKEIGFDVLGLYDITKSILENNLYGVDINEEAVEIAKLSLWIRTAAPGRKLSDLNNNIKCGNSLIDDPEIAGDKAFNWNKEFPEIMHNGGFDVVIGNPPYIGEKNNSTLFEQLKALIKWSAFYRRRSNSYYFFIKLGIDLLRNNGQLSYIVPREFLTADWANKLRKYILDNSKLTALVDFKSFSVFNDAGTSSLILSTSKSLESNRKDFNYILAPANLVNNNLEIESFVSSKIVFENFDYENGLPWVFNNNQKGNSKLLSKLGLFFEISQGIVTGADSVTNKHIVTGLIDKRFFGRGIFILNEGIDIITKNEEYQLNINSNWVRLSTNERIFIKPFIYSQHLNRWSIQQSDSYIIYFGSSEPTQIIVEYLEQFKSILINRSTIVDRIISIAEFTSFSRNQIRETYSSAGAVQKIMSRKQWYRPLYERVDIDFGGPKILVNSKTMHPFTYSDSDLFSSGGGLGGQNFLSPKQNIDKSLIIEDKVVFNSMEFTKVINSILNSKYLNYYTNNSGFNQLSTSKLSEIKLPYFQFNDFNFLLNRANELIQKYYNISLFVKTFNSRLKSNFNLEESSIPFLNFYNYDFKTFLNELKKRKITIALKLQDEWEHYFNEYKTEINKLQQQIIQTDKEIDQLVYQLYGLTPAEIKIIEESIK